MSKLPAFQFYPGDWIKDPALRRCSHEEKGIWIDLLCLMHESPERGILRGWSDEEICRSIGGRYEAVSSAVTRLVTLGVASRDEDGSLMNRRMARDERERRSSAERMRRHREKHSKTHETDENAQSNGDVAPNVTGKLSHSSSSSSTSVNIREEREADAESFEAGSQSREIPSANQFNPPTLETVKTFAASFATPDLAEQFWNAKEAVGWVDRHGNPLRKWQPAFKSYVAAARANDHQRGRMQSQGDRPKRTTKFNF